MNRERCDRLITPPPHHTLLCSSPLPRCHHSLVLYLMGWCVRWVVGVSEEKPREVVGIRKKEWKYLQEDDFVIPIQTPRSITRSAAPPSTLPAASDAASTDTAQTAAASQ